MFKRLVQLFLLFFLAAAGVLAWFAWYVSTPLLIPVGGEEPASSPVAGSLVMEPVEAVSSDGTAIEAWQNRWSALHDIKMRIGCDAAPLLTES